MCVPAYTHERKPYSANLYPTSFTLDSLLVLTIRAQRKTYVWWYTLGPMADSSCDCMFWDKGGKGLTRQPVVTATMTAAMSASRGDLGSFSSRCCAFRRTHTSADPIRLLCIRLALPLTLSLPSRLASSARLSVGLPPRAIWLAGIFLRRNKIYAGVVGTRIDWVLC